MCSTAELHSSSSQILFSAVNALIAIKGIISLPKLGEQHEEGEGKIVRRTGRCSDVQQKDVSGHDTSVPSQTYCSCDYLHSHTVVGPFVLGGRGTHKALPPHPPGTIGS